ncbi:YdiU family protein [Rhizobiaceae bacterium]|nr:YdiU family protein [Rhizobiaceae bacterium]
MIAFDNSYARLPDRFHARVAPIPVPAPDWIAFNAPLAKALGLDTRTLSGADGLQMFAGNAVPDGATPIAAAYAGQQFGHWSPQLGDGRAVLLGEVVALDGERYDIQLKGSGRTPWSRGGDGRAWLGPVMREFIVSEAMAALGIPTTRALAAVTTGESVMREAVMPGAILTRVARSHLRVGTFQYFAIREDREALDMLCSYAIKRLHPQAADAVGLLRAVVKAQAELVARWMGVGFIHGVMNTDNVAISGETIDYGPCAFMDEYRHDRLLSSIDTGGRYRYGQQPAVAHWNLVQFAQSLLPLIDNDADRAIVIAQAEVDSFAPAYEAARLKHFAAKIGIDDSQPDDVSLIDELLAAMETEAADFSNTFRALADGPPAFDMDSSWIERWQRRAGMSADMAATIRAANPAVIPRNHLIERAIAAGLEEDFAPFETLWAATTAPFVDPEDTALFGPPKSGERVLATFCGT